MAKAIEVELTKEEVLRQSDTDKVNSIIKIAYAIHENVLIQHKILFGNGEPKAGLCFQVALTRSHLNWLIGFLSTVGIAVLTYMLSLL